MTPIETDKDMANAESLGFARLFRWKSRVDRVRMCQTEPPRADDVDGEVEAFQRHGTQWFA